MKRFSILLTVSMLLLFGCGGENSDAGKDAGEDMAAKTGSDVVVIELTGNDMMQYNLKKIEVPAGSTVRINLKHIGKMPLTAMGHNVVVLQQGVNLADFAIAAMKAVDNQYIPQDRTDEVIAHTDMIGGGESTSVEFKAPPKGTYKFMCSFPGHYGTMQGDFIVK